MKRKPRYKHIQDWCGHKHRDQATAEKCAALLARQYPGTYWQSFLAIFDHPTQDSWIISRWSAWRLHHPADATPNAHYFSDESLRQGETAGTRGRDNETF